MLLNHKKKERKHILYIQYEQWHKKSTDPPWAKAPTSPQYIFTSHD